jgi:hypothetical protein
MNKKNQLHLERNEIRRIVTVLAKVESNVPPTFLHTKLDHSVGLVVQWHVPQRTRATALLVSTSNCHVDHFDTHNLHRSLLCFY